MKVIRAMSEQAAAGARSLKRSRKAAETGNLPYGETNGTRGKKWGADELQVWLSESLGNLSKNVLFAPWRLETLSC
jgi:hypothetical protein